MSNASKLWTARLYQASHMHDWEWSSNYCSFCGMSLLAYVQQTVYDGCELCPCERTEEVERMIEVEYGR